MPITHSFVSAKTDSNNPDGKVQPSHWNANHVVDLGWLDVRDYGAKGDGVTDDTGAIQAAIAALGSVGGLVTFPSGVYACNLTITGSDIHLEGTQSDFNAVGTIGLVSADGVSPVVSIGNGTTATRGISLSRFSVRPKAGQTATAGIRIYGAQDVHLDQVTVRAFEAYQIQLDSSATRPTLYVFLNRLHLATGTVGGSLGLDFNYGATYTTAVYLDESVIEAATGGSYVVDLDANCRLRASQCWLNAKNNQGIHFTAASSKLFGHNVMVDSDASTDVLLTCDVDALVPSLVSGTIEIDGVASVGSGNTAALTGRHYTGESTFHLYPHVVGNLNFQDNGAAKNAQHVIGTSLTQRIGRSGTNLSIASTDGSVQVACAVAGFLDVTQGSLKLRGAATAGAAGQIVLGATTDTTVGAAGGASALPATPLGYLIAYVGNTQVKIPYYSV